MKKLEEAFTKAMKEPNFNKEIREKVRFPIRYRNSQDLSEYVAHNYDAYGKLLRELGLTK